MFNRIFMFLVSSFLLFNCIPAYSKDLSNKSIDNYMNKVANKFSRTYCNTTQFGISEAGALAFALGETNKEFKNNKSNKLLDYSLLFNSIVNSLENKCKVYNFPIKELDKLKFE